MTNRGTAYILYTHPSASESAIAHMHEAQIDGAVIAVTAEGPRPPHLKVGDQIEVSGTLSDNAVTADQIVIIYDKHGRMDNPGFLDYRCPVASDLPMVDAILVEVPNPSHPYGAKGVGEVNICPPMAAIANAIDNAIGRRLTELPMSPPKIRAALDHSAD